MLTLSELITKAQGINLPPGDIPGKCMFCGKECDGFEPVISDSFTNANICSGGSVICPACHYVNKAEIPGAKQSAGKLYRANMWYATESGVGVIRFPKRELKEGETGPRDLSDVFRLPERTPRSILVDPPEPSFAIYLTESYKKSGWQAMLRCNGGVSHSRDRFFVGFDYSNVLVDHGIFMSRLDFIDDLRSKGVTKPELKSGNLKMWSIEKLDCDMNIINRIKAFSGDPLWYLAVHVS